MKALVVTVALGLVVSSADIFAGGGSGKETTTLADCGQWILESELLTQASKDRVAVEITFAPKSTKNPSAKSEPRVEILYVNHVQTEGEASVRLRDGYTNLRTEVFCRSCIVSGSIKLRPEIRDLVGLLGDAQVRVKNAGELVEFAFQEGDQKQTVRGKILDLGREADVNYRATLGPKEFEGGKFPSDPNDSDPDPRMVVRLQSAEGSILLIDLYEIDPTSIQVVVDEKLKILQLQTMLLSAVVKASEPNADQPSQTTLIFHNGQRVRVDGPMGFLPDQESASGVFVYESQGKKAFTRIFLAPFKEDFSGFTEPPAYANYFEGDDIVLKPDIMAEAFANDWLMGPISNVGMLLGTVGVNGELVWGASMQQMGWFKIQTENLGIMPALMRSFKYFRPGTSRAFGCTSFRAPELRR